jgi:hypothetical protein
MFTCFGAVLHPPVIWEENRRENRRGKLFIFRVYLLLGDTANIGEAALGICFPLKAFSSHPMHPVPHLLFSFETRTEDDVFIEALKEV